METQPDLVYRIAYEFLTSGKESDIKEWEFVDPVKPHKTIDKLISYFEKTEEYEKCSTLKKLKIKGEADDKKFKF